VDFQRSDLTNANLAGANLFGADLRGSRLSGAKGLNEVTNWANVFYDTDTKWPEESEPETVPGLIRRGWMEFP